MNEELFRELYVKLLNVCDANPTDTELGASDFLENDSFCDVYGESYGGIYFTDDSNFSKVFRTFIDELVELGYMKRIESDLFYNNGSKYTRHDDIRGDYFAYTASGKWLYSYMLEMFDSIEAL